MSIKSSSNQNYSSTPTFSGAGADVLSSVKGLFDRDPSSSDAGKFFLDVMQGRQGVGDRLNDQIDLIKANAAAQLPKELASARSFTRNRPDTYGGQVAANTVADNMIGRDLALAQLQREQGNQDMMNRMQAGSATAGLDANRFGQGATLLGLLRGEQGTQSGRSKTLNPYKLMSATGGLLGK